MGTTNEADGQHYTLHKNFNAQILVLIMQMISLDDVKAFHLLITKPVISNEAHKCRGNTFKKGKTANSVEFPLLFIDSLMLNLQN